ncbi:MAG TPA: arsenic resistance N-acetyltransferase ArsN2 [Rhizomicrobium sp.]|nr:arsenic resistance N-acetyltransferase ArsN2 [Rhizomicrobium sp.]
MSADTIRAIAPGDASFAAMVDCLRAADLPTSDLAEGAAQYFQLGDDAAYGGFATYGSDGLLRSLVVAGAQRAGTGSTLLAELLAAARGRGLRDIWLLTTSAEDFFARHGFAKVERDTAPAAIGATSQFKDLCPISAAFMHRRLS